jgi:hypothetical protein
MAWDLQVVAKLVVLRLSPPTSDLALLASAELPTASNLYLEPAEPLGDTPLLVVPPLVDNPALQVLLSCSKLQTLLPSAQQHQSVVRELMQMLGYKEGLPAPSVGLVADPVGSSYSRQLVTLHWPQDRL